MKRPVIALALLGAMLYATWPLLRVIPGSFVSPEDQGWLVAAVTLPDGASLHRSEQLTRHVAEIFAAHPAVEYHSALTGFSLLDGQFKTNTAPSSSPSRTSASAATRRCRRRACSNT